MATKTEQRLKEIIKEYLDETFERKQKEVVKSVSSIFIWGFIFGYVAACSNIFMILIGIVAGYTLAKKEVYAIDSSINKILWLTNFHHIVDAAKKRMDIPQIKNEEEETDNVE